MNTDCPFSVITLQETHISADSDVNLFHIPDYSLVYDTARINSFGGVAIYVHNSFSFNRLGNDDFKQNSNVFEGIFLEIFSNCQKQKKYVIGSIYRRPSDLVVDISQFIDEFTTVLSNIHATCKQSYINGDYNIDLLKLQNNAHYNTFYENVTAQGFFPKITRPTRSFENSHSLIDNTFTNNLSKPHTSGILTHHVSDHFMHFSIVEDSEVHSINHTKYIETETISLKSIATFKSSINKANLITQFDLNPLGDPNVNYNILAHALSEAKQKHIPRKVKRFNKRKHFKHKWMTNDLLTLINKKNDRYRDWKSTTDNILYEIKKINFKTFEKIVNNEITAAKSLYYFNTFTAQKNDMKKTWSTINETLNRSKNKSDLPNKFLVDNRTITDPKEIANSFNVFFSTIGTNLSSNVNNHNTNLKFNDYLNHPTDHRFKFQQVSTKEVVSIINKLKNKTSSGKDEISNKLLKSIKDEISEPLTVIINQSLLTGIFPEKLKIAKVKPLYKKGDKCCFNNYRPISILPTISKVFERVMYTQLYNYFNVNNLLTEQQYGFRSKHSTELASIKLVDYIIMEMDDPKTTKTPTTVYLDLSKAFDTLNYDIFVSKLEYYGIIGIPLALIKSYLINRFQYVQYENMTSELLEIKTGIPQGSILGPLFFSILINDLVNSSRLFSFFMYADDTTIYFNLEDFPANNREIAINKELDKVNVWLNKLTLNVEKTKCMFFRKKRTPEKISLSIDNKSIDAVSHFNFLGLLIDENLSWKYHITMVTNKLSKISGVLHRLKYIYPQHVLVAIYKSLFVPHLNYGSLLWGHNFDTVFKLQKNVVRTITNSAYIAHSEPILKRLSLLKVQDMYEFKI